MAGSLHSSQYRVLVERLSRARREAGLTQAQLAARLGKPQSFVAKYEGMERRLDLVETLEIARQTGLDPHALIDEVVAAEK